ncbi:MAG: DUF3035 domain-containing protein [Alphaproteobacteria bacterium]|jgi:hypothetical protein
MRAKIVALSAVLVAATAVSGCGNIRDATGVSKKAPDEFAVLRRAPLSVPPNFTLRPPRVGERALPQIDPNEQARTAVFGGQAALAERSPADSAGEEALLQALRIKSTDSDIRRTVDRESSLLSVDQRNFVETLMFWRTPPPPGIVVDATEERRRIQENDALGQSQTQGSTPSIERKETVRNRIF